MNGRTLQQANTADMYFGVATIVSHCSQAFTLEPGDVIATGTPAGVGVFRDPPILLGDGDEVVVEIEGIGRLVNTCRFDRVAAGVVSDERFLVTGALGCIGAWTVRALVREGVPVTTFDLGGDPRRLRQIMTADELASVDMVAGDITDLDGLSSVMEERGIDHVIHLAALQVPFCRADPPLGARVNVVGTINVFEAVKRRARTVRMAPISYTSSIGMFSGDDADPLTGRLGRRRRRPSPEPLRRLQARRTRAAPASTGSRTASRASACGRSPSTASAAIRA